MLRGHAEQNLSGVAFLGAYGLSWLVCGLIWGRVSERTAALATLFQGLVAFPVALGSSALIGAIGEGRAVPDEITQLAVLIGTSQLLGLPFVIVLVVRRQYTAVPFAFAVITSMHFVLYAWLYQTPIYIAMAVAISLGSTAVTLRTATGPRPAAARICRLTGGLLLITAVVLLVLHVLGRR